MTQTYSSFDLESLWSHPETPLQFHLWETASHSQELINQFSLSSLVPIIIAKKGLQKGIFDTVKLDSNFISEVSVIIGLSHDLGKATTFFQRHVRGEKVRPRKLSEHSLLSSFFGFYLAMNYCKGNSLTIGLSSELKPLFNEIIATLVYLVIRRHHSNLKSADDDILDLLSLTERNKENLLQQLTSIDPILLEKMVNDHFQRATSLGLLTTELVFSWSEFYTWLTVLFEGKQTISRKWLRLLRRQFKQQRKKVVNGTDIYSRSFDSSILSSILLVVLLYSVLQETDKSSAMKISMKARRKDISFSEAVMKYQSGLKSFKSPLNDHRNEIFNLSREKAQTVDLDNDRLLTLNVPTGFGKTLSGLIFATTLRDRIIRERGRTPRIIYAMPFLSIIEQNYSICELILRKDFPQNEYKTIPTDILLKHHHLSEIAYETDTVDNSDFTPNEALFMIEGWQSEIIVTTFYQFLYSFLTRRKNLLRKFQSIGGAIVILDEVQNVDGHYWEIIRNYLKALAFVCNIYFVLTTATLPLIFTHTEIEPILPSENVKSYYNSLDRVILDVDLEAMVWNDFLSWLNELLNKNPTKNIMFVMNTIKSSKKLFYDINDIFEQTRNEQRPQLYYLSTYVTPKERLERIKNITEILREISTPKRVILITTQLVEAGVDLDFDIIVRDFGPLDSIFQVAGRCNRHFKSKRQGLVYVRKLLDPLTEKDRILSNYIYDSILQDATEQVLRTYGNKGLRKRIPESEFFTLAQEYYRELRNRLSQDTSMKLLEAAATLDFNKLDDFKLIKDDYSREAVFIELDKKAHEVWQEYEKISKDENLFERKQLFLAIRKQFYEFVISIKPDLAKNLPLSSGFRLLPFESLEQFYDNSENEGTGFLDQAIPSESRSLIF